MDFAKKNDCQGCSNPPVQPNHFDNELAGQVKSKLGFWNVKAEKSEKVYLEKGNDSNDDCRMEFRLRECQPVASGGHAVLSLVEIDRELQAIEQRLLSIDKPLEKMSVLCDDIGGRYVFHGNLSQTLPEINARVMPLLNALKTLTSDSASKSGVQTFSGDLLKELQSLDREKRVPRLTKKGVIKRLESYHWHSLSRLESLLIYRNLIYGANISFTRRYVWEVLCSDKQLLEWVLENFEYFQMLCDFTRLMPADQRSDRNGGQDFRLYTRLRDEVGKTSLEQFELYIHGQGVRRSFFDTTSVNALESSLVGYGQFFISWLRAISAPLFRESTVQINSEDLPPWIMAYLFFDDPKDALRLSKLMLHESVKSSVGFECIQRILTSLEYLSERLRANKNLHANYDQAKAMCDILDVLLDLVKGGHSRDKVINNVEQELVCAIEERRKSIDDVLVWISGCATKNAADLEAEEVTGNKESATASSSVKPKGRKKSGSDKKLTINKEDESSKGLDSQLERHAFILHAGIDKSVQDFHAGHSILRIQDDLVQLESKLTTVDVARARYALADLAITKLHDHLKFVSDSTFTIKAFRGFIDEQKLPDRFFGKKFCEVIRKSEEEVSCLEPFFDVMCFAFPRFDKFVQGDQGLVDEIAEEIEVLRKKEKEVRKYWSGFVDELADIKKLYNKRGELIRNTNRNF
ncbi:hypothetical protein [Endozoicomonas atrinae]|uniref:hypothetical protein n=1 Tax=Endozoicomonas atrinae TaxID=1333660 RepID=UPI000825A956|nr:hypothetical protein [Endozoicomonas atrinae]